MLVINFSKIKKKRQKNYYCLLSFWFTDSMRVKNPTGFKILAKVLDVMIDCPRKNLLESLISSIIKVHDYTSNPEYRRYLFSILLKVAFSEKNTLVREMESFKKWINSLPDKLLEETIPLYVIKAILKIVNQGVEREVNKNLEEKVFLILSALPNIQVEGCKNSFEGQKLIVHILYWCDDKVLENLLEKKSSWDKFYSQELKNCVLNVISYRLNNRRN